MYCRGAKRLRSGAPPLGDEGDDRLSDLKTNNPYYVAFVQIDQAELAARPNIKLYPGMPATVMIPTVQRTAFDYVVGNGDFNKNEASDHNSA
jgi:hypothetical protein